MNEKQKQKQNTTLFADMLNALQVKLNFTKHRPPELTKHRAGLHYALTYINQTVDKYEEMKGLPLNEGQLGNHLKLLTSAVCHLTYAQAALTETLAWFLLYVNKNPDRESITETINDATSTLCALPNIAANATDVAKLFFTADVSNGKVDVSPPSVKEQFEESFRKYSAAPVIPGSTYLSQEKKKLYHIYDVYFSFLENKVMVLASSYADIEQVVEDDPSVPVVISVRYRPEELHRMEACLFQEFAVQVLRDAVIVQNTSTPGGE